MLIFAYKLGTTVRPKEGDIHLPATLKEGEHENSPEAQDGHTYSEIMVALTGSSG